MVVVQGGFVGSWVGGRGPEVMEEEGGGWMGGLVVLVEGGGRGALGSWSQLKREPKRKCWTTGNLERTSALYILIMPWVSDSSELAPRGLRWWNGGSYLVDFAPSCLDS